MGISLRVFRLGAKCEQVSKEGKKYFQTVPWLAYVHYGDREIYEFEYIFKMCAFIERSIIIDHVFIVMSLAAGRYVLEYLCESSC